MEVPNKKFVFIIIGFLLLVAVAAGIFWFSGGYGEWLTQRQARRQADKAAEVQARVEKAYRNDTFGGKTPQETLDMFVAALRAGDVELASKYFALDDNLSNQYAKEDLIAAKNENRFNEIVNLLIKAVSFPQDRLYENDFKYIVKNDKGVVMAEIDMELSPITKVWKIESL